MSIRIALVLLPGLAALLAAPAAQAETPHRGAASPIEAWVQQVNAQIAKAMDAPSGTVGRAAAYVRRADDGRIMLVRIASPHPRIESAARGVLARMGTLPPLPRGVDPNQLVRVDLLFNAKSERAFEESRQAMLAAAAEANRKLAVSLDARPVILSSVP